MSVRNCGAAICKNLLTSEFYIFPGESAFQVLQTSDLSPYSTDPSGPPYLFFSDKNTVYRKNLASQGLFSRVEDVTAITSGEKITKLGAYVGNATTHIYILTDGNSLLEARIEQGGHLPVVPRTVDLPSVGGRMYDFVVDWLDEDLVVAWHDTAAAQHVLSKCSWRDGGECAAAGLPPQFFTMRVKSDSIGRSCHKQNFGEGGEKQVRTAP